MQENPRIVLAVPGFWADRTDLLQSIASESGGYVLAGNILLQTNTKNHWELNEFDGDPKIVQTLSLTGEGSINTDHLSTIAEHNMVCVMSGEGGSPRAAKQIIDAAAGLLRAGGAAIYVESSGKSHSRADWTHLSESNNSAALFEAFVALINGDKGFYTCGMHALGLPDASVDGGTATTKEVRLLRAFNLYRLLEGPELETGHTFSLTAESTFYRLALLPCDTYEPDDLFYNPYGVWHLTPL